MPRDRGMLRPPARRHGSIEACSDQPCAGKEAQQTPNGSCRILATDQGELLRSACHKISNLPGGEVVPVDLLTWKNADQQSPCFRQIMFPRPLGAAASFQMPIKVVNNSSIYPTHDKAESPCSPTLVPVHSSPFPPLRSTTTFATFLPT